MAFRQGDSGDLGQLGAIAIAEGLGNLRLLANAYQQVHRKR